MNEILDIFENGLDQAGQLGSDLLGHVDALKINLLQYSKFLCILIFGILLISSLTRFLFGKKNQINLAMTSAMEILCVYVINVVIYALGLHLQQFILLRKIRVQFRSLPFQIILQGLESLSRNKGVQFRQLQSGL